LANKPQEITYGFSDFSDGIEVKNDLVVFDI
jgi:hypothetical protein